ncbi:MAG: primosomal protein N' [Gammaproteobacteria bacterium]|nr:primosomal protein N' [Gammaproteobacteria bacterium]
MTDAPQYLEIAVATPLRRQFHYGAPASGIPLPGVRCRVPFGNRQVVGMVLGASDEPGIERSKIKPVGEVLDHAPILPSAIIRLCKWASTYYHHPIGEVFAGALPALLRQGEPLLEAIERLHLTPEGEATSPEALLRAPRQGALLRALRSTSGGLARLDIKNLELSPAVVKAVVDKGLARWHTETGRWPVPFDPAALSIFERPVLSNEQTQAVESAADGTTLLYGITGSGKTEVYLRVIEQVVRQGRQALVLVPEIALTPQTIRRFTDRFNVPVVALHSGLTNRERLDGWRRAAGGEAAVIIGTRSAIFTPMRAPGVIVVDEEHDGSFKQQDGFRYHARDLAVMRGQLEEIPVLLGSATPSLESWHNARRGRYRLTMLTRRAAEASPPHYQVLNLRHEQVREGFAESLLTAIQRRLEAGEQVLVFLNRRGFSPALLCPDCAWIAECRRCDARMTLHRATRSLICHHCGATRAIDRSCPSCNGMNLIPVGEGTQRIETTLATLFPNFPVLRIDRDSTRPRRAMESFMQRIGSGEPVILVGTQMLAKGHHFPNVTLVVIKDMDAAFYSANYKSSERTGQLILQVGGRAGREEKPGTVAIETHVPEQPMFRQLIDDGYAAFADELLAEREQYELPPFYHHALLRAEAPGKSVAVEFLESVAGKLTCPPRPMCWAPYPPRWNAEPGAIAASSCSLPRPADRCTN